jgi:hypothetical protein
VTKDNLENLANELANCTKTLLRIVEALENEMNNSKQQNRKRKFPSGSPFLLKKSGKRQLTSPVRDSRQK